jgi:hypothetical protein
MPQKPYWSRVSVSKKVKKRSSYIFWDRILKIIDNKNNDTPQKLYELLEMLNEWRLLHTNTNYHYHKDSLKYVLLDNGYEYRAIAETLKSEE